jgi:hypothetical protein
MGLDAYIPDRKFRNRDPRFDTQKWRRSRRFTLKDFHHDAALDQYIAIAKSLFRTLRSTNPP